MVVRANPSTVKNKGRVVRITSPLPAVKSVKSLTDGEVMAYAIKRWADSGLIPATAIDLSVVLAIGRTLRRR